jgi:hypothetical protein
MFLNDSQSLVMGTTARLAARMSDATTNPFTTDRPLIALRGYDEEIFFSTTVYDLIAFLKTVCH